MYYSHLHSFHTSNHISNITYVALGKHDYTENIISKLLKMLLVQQQSADYDILQMG